MRRGPYVARAYVELNDQRYRAGLTIDELARLSGVSRRTVASVMRGAPARRHTLRRIRAALELKRARPGSAREVAKAL